MKLNQAQALRVTGPTKGVYDGRRRRNLMDWMDDFEAYTLAPPAVHNHEVSRDRYGIEHLTALALFEYLVGPTNLSMADADTIVRNNLYRIVERLASNTLEGLFVGMIRFSDPARKTATGGSFDECIADYNHYLKNAEDIADADGTPLDAHIPTALILVDVSPIYRSVRAKILAAYKLG